MAKTCFAIFLLGMIRLAAGCDPPRMAKLEEGMSTDVDVCKQFGDPVTVAIGSDGEEIGHWRYKPVNESKLATVKSGADGKVAAAARTGDAREPAQAERAAARAQCRHPTPPTETHR